MPSGGPPPEDSDLPLLRFEDTFEYHGPMSTAHDPSQDPRRDAPGPPRWLHAWRAGGPLLPGEPPPGELARRLSEPDLAFLTPRELEAFMAACRRLEDWVRLRAEAARRERAARTHGRA